MAYVPITVGRRRTIWTVLADMFRRLFPEKEDAPPQATSVGAQPRAGVTAQTVANTPLLSDPFRLAIMIALFESIAKTTGFVPLLSSLRPAMLLFIFCILYAVARPKKAIDFKLFSYRVPRLVAYQLIVACFSAVFGMSLGGSATFILKEYWKLIAFSLLMMASLRGAMDVRRLTKAAAIAGMVLAFFSVFIIRVSKDRGTDAYDANDIGLIVVMSLPLVLLLIQTSVGTWKYASYGGIALIIATTILTASRGAFVGLLAVGIALLFFAPGISAGKRTLAVIGIVGAAAVFAPARYWEMMSKTFLDPTSDYNFNAGQGRKELAKRGISYMLRYPVFGVGIGNFARAELDPTMSAYAAQQAAKHAGVVESAPHNSWIEAGSETGITGVVLWWLLIVGSAWGVLRLRRDMPLEWATGTLDQRFLYLSTIYIPIAMLGFVVCATFVSFAWSDQSYALPAIALGVQKAFAEQMALGSVPVLQAAGPVPGVPSPKPAARRKVRRAYGHVVGMDGVHSVTETRPPRR